MTDLSFFLFSLFPLFSSSLQANFKETYMAAFYDYFNEQKYADSVKNVSVSPLYLLARFSPQYSLPSTLTSNPKGHAHMDGQKFNIKHGTSNFLV